MALAVILASTLPALPVNRQSTFHLYRSTDHGLTWSRAGTGLPSLKRINALAVTGAVSYAGTDDGVFFSVDGGVTWSASAGPAVRIQCFATAQDRTYAGSIHGVFVTEDRGRSWRDISRGLPDLNIRSIAALGSLVFAGTNSKGVFVLDRHGSWTPFGEALPAHAQIFDLAVTDGHVYAALYSNGLFRIDAGGGRWERIGDVSPLEVLAKGGNLIAGHNPGGIQHSINGGTSWKPAIGLSGPAPIWVLGEAGPNMLAGTTPGTVVRSEDSGATWKPSADGLPEGAAVVAIASDSSLTLVATVM